MKVAGYISIFIYLFSIYIVIITNRQKISLNAKKHLLQHPLYLQFSVNLSSTFEAGGDVDAIVTGGSDVDGLV